MGERESSGEARYYGPLIEFDSDEPEFVRGLEIGHLMGELDHNRDKVERLLHCFNEEMLRRVAHAYGREYSVEMLGDGWLVARLEPPTKPNIMDAMKPPGGS